MIKPECAKLLREIAAIDNRKIDQEVLDAWFAVIGYLPYEVALNALHMARKDDRVTWLEPKHIISWSRDAREKIAREDNAYLEEAKNDVFGPIPYCVHGEVLAICIPCCKDMAAKDV